MYLRMLRKDLRDKIGLNIVLCIFMVIAATVVIMSTGFIYTFLAGIQRTYDICKTTDGLFVVGKSYTDEDGQRRVIEEILAKHGVTDQIYVSDCVMLRNARLEFEGVDRRGVTGLYEGNFLVYQVNEDRNIPYSQEDKTFTLSDGCVAIPQVMAEHAKAKVGSKFYLTTDMGNKYEFLIAEIYKDPSSVEMRKVLFSDHDFEAILQESGCIYDLYEFSFENGGSDRVQMANQNKLLEDELSALSTEGIIESSISHVTLGKSSTATDEAAITMIISIFMLIMGISMILIIFMSIRFSLRATIKREEKEIGTMKAIGVDSLSYKSLFIVKYVAFASVGSVAGLFAGIPLGKMMIGRFVFHTIRLDDFLYALLGIFAGVVFILVMVLFSFIALRRINRISVMDAIHGENRGERFSKVPGLRLYRLRKMKIPLFLALEDVIRKTKRYVYVVVSYTLGLYVLFTIFQLKDTLISDTYRRTYWTVADREVFIRPEDDLRLKLVEKTGSYRNTFLYYEEYYNENGIPLNIQIMDEQDGFLLASDKKIAIRIWHGDYEMDQMTLVKGGRAPKLSNEVVISHAAKDRYGIKLGDVVTLEYRTYQEDVFAEETKQKDFIVTAFAETLGNYVEVFANHLDDNMVMTGEFTLFNEGIDCADDEYDAYIEKMRALNQDIMIWDYDQLMDYDMGNQFGTILDLLALFTGIIVALTIFAMTFLYQQIFIEEETADIAMLKSLGIDKKEIKKWQYFRIMILVFVATVLAVLLSFTFTKVLFNELGKWALLVGSFLLVSPSVKEILLLPLGLIALVSCVMLISFQPIDGIKIWKIREE